MSRVLLSFFILIACIACGTHSNTSNGSGANTDHGTDSNVALPAGDFYKRYAGTVAGKPVVAHITRYGGTFSGSYQYPGVSRIIDLNADSVSGNFVRFAESVPGPARDTDNAESHWKIMITAKGISGEWTGPHGLNTGNIELKEEYPEGSYRLLAITRQDSASLPDDRAEPHATASLTGIFAEGGDAAATFINTRLRQALRLAPGGDIAAAMQARLKSYFSDYKKENAALLKDEKDTSLYWTFNFSQDETLNVLYNDKGWLVIQDFASEYTGGAHGNYGSSYLNLDVAGARQWTLHDVVADTAALSPLLNLAARNYFHIPQGAGMDEVMLVTEVPVTDNFYLTPEGLSFIYNPYEIASYADGAIQLYLPYKRLMSLLTPAFKERMHLSASAGIALRSIEKKAKTSLF